MIPCLYGDLRLALATLYNLPQQQQHHSLTSHQAHEFLLQFQSRNVRRKLQSHQQRLADMARKGQQQQPGDEIPSDDISYGSSWLACLMLLFSPDAHSAERLFCAQTIAHRLRRNKVAEAIDWEIEMQPGLYQAETTPLSYQQWITSTLGQHDSSLGQLLAIQMDNQRGTAASMNHLIQDEERIKGELTLITLAFLAYHHATPVTEHTQPLLTTLGAAMGALALRLRYTPQSMAQNLTASATPVVLSILQSLQSVAMASGEQTPNTNETLSFCACACLGSIPDTILASPGGARGKLSIDPRCIVAAHQELRNPATGVHPLWQAVHTSSSGSSLDIALLITCERWAKYLPLPWDDFVEPTLAYTKHHMAHPAAMAYLVAIFEAACWTPQEILRFSLGISAGQQNQQSSKQKQSSKSKNRKKQILQEGSTASKLNECEAECQHRGDVACRTTAIVWKELRPLIASSPEGVACLCACANACLPHWIRHGAADPELVQSIMAAFQDICSHPNRNIRGQTYEPLCSLHTAMHQTVNSPLESIMADHLFHCSMRLATSCGYPPHYFQNMGEESDEELEIERNDVRDVLRAVSGGEDVYSGPPRSCSLRVLDGIVKTCTTSILQERDPASGLPHETALHALTALAKPLNILAEAYARDELSPPESIETLTVAFHGLSFVAEKLVDALPKLPTKQVFALARLLNLGMASLCPAFSAICRRNHFDSEMNQTLRNSIHAAALSVVHIPELAEESTLDHTQFDIRGAFRSPGGEDHVGILVFGRFSNEGDELVKLIVRLGHENGGTLLMDLCRVHDDLKVIENERGPGIHHGKGVTPRTRRILLETICRFTETAKSTQGLLPDGGAQAEKLLQNLFHSAVVSVAEANPQLMNSAAARFQICEVAFDLASFSSSLVSQLFAASSSEPLASKCVSTMIQAGVHGYKQLNVREEPDDALIQYGRLRAALMTLIQASASPDLPTEALEAVVALTKAECKAVTAQCQAGPSSQSSIFNDNVVGNETLPAGAFLIVVGQVLAESKIVPLRYLQALAECSSPILEVLTHRCRKLSASLVVDPRPTLCEAWFLTVSSLADHTKCIDRLNGCLPLRNKIIADTLCASMILVLYPSLEMDPSKRANDLGMSLDGGQTLAIMKLFEKMFALGPEQVQLIARELQNRLQAELPQEEDATLTGMAVIGAILFRASSGGLPPWSIEGTPITFAAFFHGCGKCALSFGQVMQASMKVRLAPAGGVKSDTCLAGRFFETMNETNRQDFIRRAVNIATEDNMEGWKRFKSLLKQASGGKKKASGFNLKPSPTSWDCDRL